MKHTRAWTLFLLVLTPGLAYPDMAWAAQRIFIAGGLSGENYAAGVFGRIGEVWDPPQGLYGEYRTEIELLIDSSGMLQDCVVKHSSGHDTFDTSACGAAHKVGRFAPPPDGQAVRLACTLQIRKPSETPVDPDEELKRQVRERAQRDREYRVREAGYAEEDARARAEAVARERGESFAGYEFAPGQHIPGARELRERTPVKPLPEPKSRSLEEKREPSQVVVPGPVISRYPPKPGLTDLVIESRDIRNNDVHVQTVPAGKVDGQEKKNSLQKEEAPGTNFSGQSEQEKLKAEESKISAPGVVGKTAQESSAAAKHETTSAQGPGARQDWVVPQPPLPSAQVKGRVIDPKAPATPLPLSDERKAEIAAEAEAARSLRREGASGQSSAKAVPAPSVTDKATRKSPAAKHEATSTQGQEAKVDWVVPQPPPPSAQVKGRVIDPKASATQLPLSDERKAEIAAEAEAARSLRREGASGQSSAKAVPAPSVTDKATRKSPAAKHEPDSAQGQGAKVDWVVPQPPLPSTKVQGKVIDPKAPVTPFPLSDERKAEIAAEVEAARAARALRREEAAGRSSAPTASEGIASKKEDTQPSYFEQPNNSPGAAR